MILDLAVWESKIEALRTIAGRTVAIAVALDKVLELRSD